MTDVPVKQQDDTDEKPTIGDQAAELLRDVRSKRRRFSRVKNLLAKIEGKKPKVDDYETWLEVRQKLDGYELGVAEIDEAREVLVTRIGTLIDRMAIKKRMKFSTKLDTLLSTRGLEVEKISESPLVLYIEPLTFEVDFDGGSCKLLFGHEPIDELALDADAIVETHEATVARLNDESVDSEQFFELLHAAYRTVLVADGGEPGERVDLVDVLVPMAMLRADRDALRKKGPGAMEPFERHLLAYQLAQLRSDGLLERDGVRLDLGAATGGSTKDKKDVLYIPVGATGGQYYRALRFES